VKSAYAYIGGFASTLLSLIYEAASRNKTGDSKTKPVRSLGYIHRPLGATFIALRVALKLEEK
jgi:hypothetical protein